MNFSLIKKIARKALAYTVCCSLFWGCSAQDQPINVLMVGNSSLYYNNLPAILEAIGKANGLVIETKLIAKGGYTLEDHFAEGDFQKILAEKKWDYTILNEQSRFGEVFLVNGNFRIKESQSFYKTVEKFDELIKRNQSQTIIFSLYPRKNQWSEDESIINHCYDRAAQLVGARLVPASQVWQKIIANDQTIELYNADLLHPSPIGSYASALAIFSQITSTYPKKLPTEVYGNEIEEGEGTVTTTIKKLVDLSPEIAAMLRTHVYAVKRDLDEKRGYFRYAAPPDPQIPTLTKGEKIKLASLNGSWKGTITLYPQPGTLQLSFSDQGISSYKIIFEGNEVDGDIQDFNLTDDRFEFTNMKGPNGGVIHYKGVLKNGVLEGIAEIIVEGQPVYGIGKWSLYKGH